MLIMPTAPLDLPSAWTGSKIENDEWIYHLAAQDMDELTRATERVKQRGLPIERISAADFPLPTLAPRLKDFAAELEDGRGFVLLRGLPIGELPLEDVRIMYFGASVHMGIPVAQNGKNSLLGSVRDEGTPFGPKVRGYQSHVRLDYHNDSAAVVGLCCVKAAKKGGVSKIVSAVTAHNLMMAERPDLLEVLYTEPYYFSWKADVPRNGEQLYWSKVFAWYDGRLETRWVYGIMTNTQREVPEAPRMSAAQTEALDYFFNLLNRPELCLDMHFQPGDVQYLNNATVLHSRTEFEDYDDPAERRHLLRVWLNWYYERRTAPNFTNRYDLLGDASANPHRRLFDVEVYDTW